MKIGIFGGSFDPIHLGHVNLAKTAIEKFGLDRLVVIPAAVSPFKTDAAPSAAYDRLLLVRAAFNGRLKVVVDDRELKRGGVSYAIDTVRELKAENPDAALVFLIGEDSVKGLPRWKDYDELVKLCTFEALPRTPESSTEVRRRLAAGESIDELVPYPVAEFLKYGVVYNPDGKMVETILNGLQRKDGYCPCRLPKRPEFFCPCDEFKGQLADPNYHGLCHCHLYLKP